MSNVELLFVVHGRQLTNYEKMTGDEQFVEPVAEAQGKSLAKLGALLEAGYIILDSYDSTHLSLVGRQYLLQKPSAALDTGRLEAVALYNCTVKNTWSKTHNVQFDYIVTNFLGSKAVNIFDHPDATRNTWQICQAKGWDWQGLQTALNDAHGIPAIVSFDGDWYKLIDIMSRDDYDMHLLTLDAIYSQHNDEELNEDDEEN